MFTLSQTFIPMAVFILFLILFILYRIFVLKNIKPFFPILAFIIILLCVPYDTVYDSKPVEISKVDISNIPISVSSNGFYNIYEKTSDGLVITHKIPCEKASLLVNDAQFCTLYKQYSESKTDIVSLLFTYSGSYRPVEGSENYNIIIHSSQIPAGFSLPKTLENTLPQSNTPADQTFAQENN